MSDESNESQGMTFDYGVYTVQGTLRNSYDAIAEGPCFSCNTLIKAARVIVEVTEKSADFSYTCHACGYKNILASAQMRDMRFRPH